MASDTHSTAGGGGLHVTCGCGPFLVQSARFIIAPLLHQQLPQGHMRPSICCIHSQAPAESCAISRPAKTYIAFHKDDLHALWHPWHP